MRHLSAAVACCAVLAATLTASPALSQQEAGSPAELPSVAPVPGDQVPAEADVLEYIRLFGYRQMMRVSAERQLDVVVDLVRQAHKDADPAALDLISKELKREVEAAADDAVRGMVPVFQRYLTRDDVAYLLTVGRDPRMQKVVALQPRIGEDMEAVGERLGEEVARRAAPRIEQRLKQLDDAQPL